MKLGKLLAAGKSIISGRASAKYRQDKSVYLPKFSAAKNPFAPAEKQVEAERESLAKANDALIRAKTRSLPTLAEAKPEKVEKPATAGWVSKISSVSIWRGWQAEVKEQRAAVQTELSLEAVKVVHNDLSDAGVEVVPIKSRPKVVKPVESEAVVEEKTWELAGEPTAKAD